MEEEKEQDKKQKKSNKKKNQSNKKILKIIGFSMLTLLIILVILIGVLFGYVQSKLNKINYVDIGDVEINAGIKESLSGYRSIAILGIDSYAEEDGRSDTIMIAILNEKTNEVKLTSIYRDTYVEIPGRGLDKINHAYWFGGPELALSTINVNLDLNVTEFVVVNFDSVVSAIDILGGVEIEITSDEVKYINGYINAISKGTGVATKNITTPGKYVLDGVQAVAYSRIRYTTGGDWKRTERQRTVLNKMLEKAKRASKADLLKAVDEILPLITTNIKKDEIIPTLLEINKYTIADGIGWPYNVKAYDWDVAWYGAPVTLESNVIRLHKEIFEKKDYVPSDRVKEISEKIIQKTGFLD